MLDLFGMTERLERLFLAVVFRHFRKGCSSGYRFGQVRRQSGERLHCSRKKEEVYFLRRNARKRRLG